MRYVKRIDTRIALLRCAEKIRANKLLYILATSLPTPRIKPRLSISMRSRSIT